MRKPAEALEELRAGGPLPTSALDGFDDDTDDLLAVAFEAILHEPEASLGLPDVLLFRPGAIDVREGQLEIAWDESPEVLRDDRVV